MDDFDSVWVNLLYVVNMHIHVICVYNTIAVHVGQQIQRDHVAVSQGLVQCQIPLCVTKDT